jgi:hypothetical protein
MSRPFAYGIAGVVLMGVAGWILLSRFQEDAPPDDPQEELDRMVEQTRKKVADIQRNLEDFRQALLQTKSLDSPSSG